MIQESVRLMIVCVLGVCLCMCARVCISLTVRVGVPEVGMVKVKKGSLRCVLWSECGEIAHAAGPAASPMTSPPCGFPENQTSSHS